MRTSLEITGWSIKGLTDKARKEAAAVGHRVVAERPRIEEFS